MRPPAPLQADLVAGKYMKAPPDAALADKAASKARKAQKRSGASGGASIAGTQRDFRRYQSPSGFAVLVGRNSRQNDELTCRMAQPGDVWMHARSATGAADSWLLGWAGIPMHTTALLTSALSHPVYSRAVWLLCRGVPGAHLLMRIPAGQAPAEADLRFSADLAAWFSKARTQGKADVTVADPKHISKPNGAKPGQVMVRTEKTVLGRPDESAAACSGEAD
jgi:predicted ribosome quality control (RQC) complex YloA/Tae2 family protein